MTTTIYALFCPITEEMKYIGKANNIKSRLKSHLQDFRGVPADRVIWLGKLKRKKLKPEIEILSEVDVEEWKFWEEFYIGYYKSLGIKLLQKRAGGNGLTYKNSQTFKKYGIPHNKGKKKINGKYI